MKAAHAPKIQDRHLWNAYRDKVIEAVVAVELQMKQAGRSLDVEGLTCEVAPLLGQVIEDMADYNVLSKLVRAVRPIAYETLRSTSEEHGGQFSLLLR
jgi:hypothetical protein